MVEVIKKFIIKKATVLGSSLKVPKTYQDGTIGKHEIELELDVKNKAHRKIIDELISIEKDFVGGEATYPVIKKRMMRDKETKGLIEKDGFVKLRIKSKQQPLVLDEDDEVLSGDDMIVPFNSVVKVKGEIISYDFDGKKGISLKLSEVIVIEKSVKKPAATVKENSGVKNVFLD